MTDTYEVSKQHKLCTLKLKDKYFFNFMISNVETILSPTCLPIGLSIMFLIICN